MAYTIYRRARKSGRSSGEIISLLKTRQKPLFQRNDFLSQCLKSLNQLQDLFRGLHVEEQSLFSLDKAFVLS